jgi:hypothetical protein
MTASFRATATLALRSPLRFASRIPQALSADHGQLWVHQTGHDETKGYGTKTRQWQMDVVIHLTGERALSGGLTVSWNDLWASRAHSRKMKSGRARYRNGKLLLPVAVRCAIGKTIA